MLVKGPLEEVAVTSPVDAYFDDSCLEHIIWNNFYKDATGP